MCPVLVGHRYCGVGFLRYNRNKGQRYKGAANTANISMESIGIRTICIGESYGYFTAWLICIFFVAISCSLRNSGQSFTYATLRIVSGAICVATHSLMLDRGCPASAYPTIDGNASPKQGAAGSPRIFYLSLTAKITAIENECRLGLNSHCLTWKVSVSAIATLSLLDFSSF